MRFFRRPAQRDHDAIIARLQEQARANRNRAAEKKSAEHRSLIARLSHRYYLAHAISSDMLKAGGGDPGHLIGVCAGIVAALAEITGQSEHSVEHKMRNGVPLNEDWLVTNDAPVGMPGDLRVIHDGIREPVTERLERLHRAALKADGHPMYHVLYGQKTAAV